VLLEFRVKNFKSIKDEAVLSLAASKDPTLSTSHTIETGIKAIPAVTRSAAIYGPNASGKTNLINAMGYMKVVVAQSASTQPDQKFSVKSFQLDDATKNAPSEFEITFLKDGIRYQYGFAMTPHRIVEEWLLVYKTGKPSTWISRSYNADTDEDKIEIGSGVKGQKSVWQKSTRSNALLLSVAVQLNSEQLRPVYNWITQDLFVLGLNDLPNAFSIKKVQDQNSRSQIISFLASADISIEDISIESKEGSSQKFKINISGNSPDSSIEPTETLIPMFHHKTSNGSAIFEIHEESLGTQRLFALAGPILEILKQGKTLVYDELDSSLHTLLARKLVELFHNPTANKHGAQLIFSTHDTTLLQNDLMRRDQVWFIEKDDQQASKLYPLTDFSPRKKEDLERGYLAGRYGAIPFLQGLDFAEGTH